MSSLATCKLCRKEKVVPPVEICSRCHAQPPQIMTRYKEAGIIISLLILVIVVPIWKIYRHYPMWEPIFNSILSFFK